MLCRTQGLFLFRCLRDYLGPKEGIVSSTCTVKRRRGYRGVRQEKEGRSIRVLPARGEPLDGRKTTPEGAPSSRTLHNGGGRDKADRLEKERSSESTVETTLGRARKAEKLADDIAAKLKKLQDLRAQGKV